MSKNLKNNDENILQIFLYFQSQLRLYHWKTSSYARHVASGNLYKSIDPLIDLFIEAIQGLKNEKKKKSRIEYKSFSLRFKSLDDNEMVVILKSFCKFLQQFSTRLYSSDLINIRDEMLSHIHQTLYLFTLD